MTKKGWKRFAKQLKYTYVTHMYAGSDGKLKKKMRDPIRENRTKHSMHKDKSNLDVIMNIGRMSNPRNSKYLIPKRTPCIV